MPQITQLPELKGKVIAVSGVPKDCISMSVTKDVLWFKIADGVEAGRDLPNGIWWQLIGPSIASQITESEARELVENKGDDKIDLFDLHNTIPVNGMWALSALETLYSLLAKYGLDMETTVLLKQQP